MEVCTGVASYYMYGMHHWRIMEARQMLLWGWGQLTAWKSTATQRFMAATPYYAFYKNSWVRVYIAGSQCWRCGEWHPLCATVGQSVVQQAALLLAQHSIRALSKAKDRFWVTLKNGFAIKDTQALRALQKSSYVDDQIWHVERVWTSNKFKFELWKFCWKSDHGNRPVSAIWVT